MGTFHDNLGELHGITVVVDTTGSRIIIGRCHEMNSQGILLHDADQHENGQNGLSKEQFVQKSAKFGHWARHKQLTVPKDEIVSVRRLGEIQVS